MNFENRPNYNFLKSLFLNILKKIGEKNDLMFSWVDKNITPNRIMNISKSKSKQKLYNNILLYNSKKKSTPQTSNKNLFIKEQILNKTQTNSEHKKINIKYNKENDEKINLNKRTINSEQEYSNSIYKKGNIPKLLNNNNFMKVNVTKKLELKNKLIKARKKLNLTNLNTNNHNSLLKENIRRNTTKQNLSKNLNNNNNNSISGQDNLNLKKYILNIRNLKNENEIIRNENKMSNNSINTNKFQNNNYTYTTFIKNLDVQKIDIFHRNKTYLLTDSSNQNSIIQKTFDISYKPSYYKSIFTKELKNPNIINFNLIYRLFRSF